MISYSDEIYFSLDRGSYIQFNDVRVTNEEVFRKFLGIPKDLWDRISCRFENEREQNTAIVLDYDEDILTEKEHSILDKAEDKWNDKVDEALKNLKSDYEYRMTDEAVKETLKSNDYDFTADGKVF
jgi:hypothetical protein